ncbi:MAG: hypothetical protein KF754_15325 [Planctomycetes bacterium]|nr:hypothetical protein [Planctomycetota bacterium]
MTEATTTLRKRDEIVERLMAHPFSFALGAAVLLVQVAIYVTEISGVPFGRFFALHFSEMNVGGLLFAFTHYAPVSGNTFGAGFLPLDFLFSLLLFGVCGFSLLHCGPVVEGYYGTRRTVATFVLCTLAHAAVAAAIPGGWAYSSLGFAMFLAVTSLLVTMERRDEHSEAESDYRVLVVLGGLVIAAMGAGFLPHPSYHGLLAAAGVGPVCAVTAFVLNRRLQMRRVRMRGEGKVGDLYFVDEVDLLTRTEVETRMDKLLGKIAATGMDSLTIDERRFLKHASQRLKRSPSEETRA